MKRFSLSLLVALVMTMMIFSSVFAASGGTPAAHGVDGKTFGGLVSNLAQSYPGAIADHVSNAGGNGGGMPALHGVDGKTFGSLVSWLARLYPGAIAQHVR